MVTADAQATEVDGARTTRKRLAASYVFSVYLLAAASETYLSPMFPRVRDDLDLVVAQQAALVAVLTAGIGIGNLVGGAAGYHIGDRIVIRIAAVFMAIGALLTSVAHSYVVLLIAQCVAGFGIGLFFAPGLATIGRVVRRQPRSRRGNVRPRLLARHRDRSLDRRRRRGQLAVGVLRHGVCVLCGCHRRTASGRCKHRDASEDVGVVARVPAIGVVPNVTRHRAGCRVDDVSLHRLLRHGVRRPRCPAGGRHVARRTRPSGVGWLQVRRRLDVRPVRRTSGRTVGHALHRNSGCAPRCPPGTLGRRHGGSVRAGHRRPVPHLQRALSGRLADEIDVGDRGLPGDTGRLVGLAVRCRRRAVELDRADDGDGRVAGDSVRRGVRGPADGADAASPPASRSASASAR